MAMNCLIYLFIFISSAFCSDEKLVASRRFNIRPDPAPKSITVDWGNIQYTFTYQAMGGTNEDWEIGIFHASENQVSCMVNRADGMTTYFIFQSFSLEVKGATYAVGQPYDSKNKDLSPAEFDELPKKNMVKNSKNFKNSIGKVILWAKFDVKEEL
ncbi:myeloid-derived growth factor-like [Ylistrum balloti]|uniref:myeloid-derived growth factor-like n=1 Tax=Ylistrum balloti TaxID=509963 RepID=UPI002905EB4E|nr:myeloid-derived growth factor-like [Ylistrum balloti]